MKASRTSTEPNRRSQKGGTLCFTTGMCLEELQADLRQMVECPSSFVTVTRNVSITYLGSEDSKIRKNTVATHS